MPRAMPAVARDYRFIDGTETITIAAGPEEGADSIEVAYCKRGRTGKGESALMGVDVGTLTFDVPVAELSSPITEVLEHYVITDADELSYQVIAVGQYFPMSQVYHCLCKPHLEG